MKKIILIFNLLLITMSCSNAQKKSFSKASLSEKLTDFDGKEIAFKDVLKKHKGKTLVIEIWASWCGDCVGAMPKVKETQVNNPTVDYVFISMDKSMDKWKAGVEKHELKGEQYWVNDSNGMKGSFGKSIDLDWIPRYMIVDKKGKIIIYKAIETEFDKINNTLKNIE